MMTIDWSKAPEGATHYYHGRNRFYKIDGDSYFYHSDEGWEKSRMGENSGFTSVLTPRPTEPTPYTRDEALEFLIDHLDEWPTDIDDAPLCPGWGWAHDAARNTVFVQGFTFRGSVTVAHWLEAQGLSRSQQQDPATAEQSAPDMVNHPPHYQSDNGIECIDAIRAALGHEGFVAYCIGNSMKYLWRNKVSKAEDLRKAAWYLNRASVEIESHDNP